MKEERELQDVLVQLSSLAPGPADAPKPAGQALAVIKRQVKQEKRAGCQPWQRFWQNPNRRWATAVLSLLILFTVAFSFPAVRAAASDFLGLFRVQKFAAISVSSEQLALLERVAEEGVSPGELTIVNAPGALIPVNSLAAAARETGLEQVLSPAALGEPDEIDVVEGGDGRLIIDAAGARRIIELAGADPTLFPEKLDGKRVEVVIFSGVQQSWDDGTVLLQTTMPLVEYPGNLDPVPLGEAMLQMLGMNRDEAARLARTIDWTSTLLLPIPRNVATFNEITINGSSGLALASLDGQYGAVMWQQNDVLYLLTGSGDTVELQRIANSVR